MQPSAHTPSESSTLCQARGVLALRVDTQLNRGAQLAQIRIQVSGAEMTLDVLMALPPLCRCENSDPGRGLSSERTSIIASPLAHLLLAPSCHVVYCSRARPRTTQEKWIPLLPVRAASRVTCFRWLNVVRGFQSHSLPECWTFVGAKAYLTLQRTPPLG